MIVSLLLSIGLSQVDSLPSRQVPAEEIREAVATELRGRLAAAGYPAELVVVGRIDAQQLPAGDLNIRVGEAGGRWPRSRAGVPVQLLVNDRYVRSMIVWVEMSDRREVMTFLRDYPAHAPTSQLQLEPAVVDILCCEGTPIVSGDVFRDGRLVRAVSAGAPVMKESIETTPAVVAQEEVTIEVVQGPVRVVTTGIALSDGAMGDLVTVRPQASSQVIQSRVVGAQKVLVNE